MVNYSIMRAIISTKNRGDLTNPKDLTNLIENSGFTIVGDICSYDSNKTVHVNVVLKHNDSSETLVRSIYQMNYTINGGIIDIDGNELQSDIEKTVNTIQGYEKYRNAVSKNIEVMGFEPTKEFTTELHNSKISTTVATTIIRNILENTEIDEIDAKYYNLLEDFLDEFYYLVLCNLLGDGNL